MVVGSRIALTTLALTFAGAMNPALADGGQTGTASYYWQGKGTASGERFNANAMTAAHRSLPFNTKVKVTNLRNGRSVIVRINDRGPFIRSRIIDVSRGAASELGFTGRGLTQVRIAVLGTEEAERNETLAARETEKSGETAKSEETAKNRTRVAELSPAPTPPDGGWTLVPSPSAQTQAAADTPQTP